jgi:T-complex protein 1 subunit theta
LREKKKNRMAKSMSLNAAAGLGGMLKDGHKHFEGVHGAVLRNIEAAKGIADMVQTSLGPNGMNKLVVNHLEKIFVTSDCATILRELEVQHPAAKMLVMASETQEAEYGDNTNFVSHTSPLFSLLPYLLPLLSPPHPLTSDLFHSFLFHGIR